jgi:iron complex outermembrane receptor protein
VIFRTVSRLATTWTQSQSLNHSLTLSYHSGYHDAPILADDQAVRLVNPDGTFGAFVDHNRDVKQYTILDWQSKWKFNKSFTLTGGIKNLLDRDPPFSQRIAGGGNYSGYDGRYTDPLGRQFYLVGAYKF